MTIILTRDRHIVSDYGYIVPGFKDGSKEYEPSRKLTLKPLKELVTGNGVRIGDTPTAVTTRLGHPTTIKHSGSRRQYLDYEYYTESPRVRNGDIFTESYTETYTFKAGKLIEINFNSDHGIG